MHIVPHPLPSGRRTCPRCTLPVRARAATSSRPVISSRPDGILCDAIDRTHAILPVDLFPFSVRATVIGDSDLIDSYARNACDLNGDLGLETKPVFLQPYA